MTSSRRPWRSAVLALIAAAALSGCTAGARDIDYSRDRAISDDIAATRDRGPNALRPGMPAMQATPRDEPLGAYPWTLDERHQTGR